MRVNVGYVVIHFGYSYMVVKHFQSNISSSHFFGGNLAIAPRYCHPKHVKTLKIGVGPNRNNGKTTYRGSSRFLSLVHPGTDFQLLCFCPCKIIYSSWVNLWLRQLAFNLKSPNVKSGSLDAMQWSHIQVDK